MVAEACRGMLRGQLRDRRAGLRCERLQRSASTVDWKEVRATFLWLGVGVGVATGQVVGWSALEEPASRLTLWITLLLAAGLVALAAAHDRLRAVGSTAVVVGLATLVGFEAAHVHRTMQWPTADRGAPDGLRELEIVGASFTGGACEVAAREPGHGAGIWLSAPREACPLAAGQRVAVLASALKLAEGVRLPGGVDPRRMVASRGVALHVRVDALWTLEPARSAYWSWVADARERAWQWTRGDDAASFVVASALGVRVALAPERRADVRRAGLGHLIAVSGLHVALAAWFAQVLCLRTAALLGRSPGWGVVVSWIPLLGYVGLTGASPPAVRAAMMLVLFGTATVIGRPSHGMHLLVVAAASMLLVRPAWALDPGFQLSLVAMAALVRAPAGTGLLGHSWRISWAILPVSAIHFGETGAYSVISNLVAIPVFTIWVLPAALVGWLLTPWVGPLALRPAAAGAQIVLDLSAAVAALPPVPLGAAAIVALVGLVLLPWSRRRAWLARVLPPWLASVATLGAWLWVESRPTIEPGAWFAVGKSRAHTTVAVVDDGSGGRFACLRGATLGPMAWLGLLDALGIDRVADIEPVGRETKDAPHLQELREALAREGRWGGNPSSCAYPDPAIVEPALERCSKRVGGRALVLGAGGGEPMRCFVAGREEPMRVDRPPARVDTGGSGG